MKNGGKSQETEDRLSTIKRKNATIRMYANKVAELEKQLNALRIPVVISKLTITCPVIEIANMNHTKGILPTLPKGNQKELM